MITLPNILSNFTTSRLCPDIIVNGLSVSSTTVNSGDVFLATKGLRVDGFDYIDEAKSRGAIAIIADWDGDLKTSQKFNEHQGKLGIPIIGVIGLAQHISCLASKFYSEPSKKINVMAVTGTNGKTTCVQLYTQLLNKLFERDNISGKCGCIGTLGTELSCAEEENDHLDSNLILTTPNAVSLQKYLYQFSSSNHKYVALEASSHGLDQYRLSGVEIDTAIFTNLSRDHLDYHATMQDYAASKMKLFKEHKIRFAVVNIDDDYGRKIHDSLEPSIEAISYSISNLAADIHCKNFEVAADGIIADVVTPWGLMEVKSSLLGKFNLYNLLAVASAYMISLSNRNQDDLDSISEIIPQLKAPLGRMEVISNYENGGPRVIIDYAHTPDALENSLVALRSHCRHSLWVVFGCGGDRDRGKRSQMGEIAEKYADHIILTNDNPRTESQERIIEDVKQNLNAAVEVEYDRSSAIFLAITSAESTDTVIIAGKGHENYQLIGNKQYFFSDKRKAQEILSKTFSNKDSSRSLAS